MDDLGPEYARGDDAGFVARYQARCHCAAVRYEVNADPVDAKLCHCRECQVLHGAPMQWAAIFEKCNVRFVAGVEHLRFYSSARGRFAGLSRARELPCKVSCGRCGTPIADEGRTMWLGFPELFDFGEPRRVPDAFLPTCHIFYASSVVEVADDRPRWAGHKGQSQRV